MSNGSLARRARNSSKRRFQAAAWIVAVRVMTPSRSNNSASKALRSISRGDRLGDRLWLWGIVVAPSRRPHEQRPALGDDVLATADRDPQRRAVVDQIALLVVRESNAQPAVAEAQ